MGFSDFPLMNRHAFSPGPTHGCPYIAVGMHRALESAIGLPSRSTSVSRMLVLVTPPDVRRSFKIPPDSISMDWLACGPDTNRETHRLLNEANVSASRPRALRLTSSSSRCARGRMHTSTLPAPIDGVPQEGLGPCPSLTVLARPTLRRGARIPPRPTTRVLGATAPCVRGALGACPRAQAHPRRRRCPHSRLL